MSVWHFLRYSQSSFWLWFFFKLTFILFGAIITNREGTANTDWCIPNAWTLPFIHLLTFSSKIWLAVSKGPKLRNGSNQSIPNKLDEQVLLIVFSFSWDTGGERGLFSRRVDLNQLLSLSLLSPLIIPKNGRSCDTPMWISPYNCDRAWIHFFVVLLDARPCQNMCGYGRIWYNTTATLK